MLNPTDTARETRARLRMLCIRGNCPCVAYGCTDTPPVCARYGDGHDAAAVYVATAYPEALAIVDEVAARHHDAPAGLGLVRRCADWRYEAGQALLFVAVLVLIVCGAGWLQGWRFGL
jgi:hypothetical protein